MRGWLRSKYALPDGGVVGRKLISLKAKIADPQFRPVVHLSEGIQDGLAGLTRADQRIVLNRWQVGSFFKRSEERSQWNDHSRCFQPTVKEITSMMEQDHRDDQQTSWGYPESYLEGQTFHDSLMPSRSSFC